MKLKSYVKTVSGASAQRLSATRLLVPMGFWLVVDSGTVYIGDSDVDSTHGIKIPTTPLKFGDFTGIGQSEQVDLYDVWVVGSGNEVIRVLYAKETRLE